MLILGHRGYPSRFPENTAAGFRAALAAGADGVECDVQQSSDGHFVIAHDPTLERTSNGKGELRQTPLQTLRTLDFGQGEKILTLAEFVQLVPADKWANIEIKSETIDVEAATRAAQELRELRPPTRTLISSFEHTLLPPFRAAGYAIGALMGEEHFGRDWRRSLHTLLLLRPDYFNLPVELFARLGEWPARVLCLGLRAAGYRLAFWTLNEEREFALVRPLADAIITNETDLLRTYLLREPHA